MKFDLLKKLVEVHAPSGDEYKMRDFLESYRKSNQDDWKVKPTLLEGEFMQDCLIWVFGEQPKLAAFAHMDSIGYTVRYQNQLVKIGGPKGLTGTHLVGEDSNGKIEGELILDKESKTHLKTDRIIDRGTSLTYKPNFRETDEYIQSPYLDNRLGVWNLLQVAETLENGILVFSCWEEHGGGSVAYLGKIIQEKFGVHQALISDITWVTEGVRHGNGVAISMRDRGIPRQSYVRKIIQNAKDAGIDFQLEVEDAGGSDGNVLMEGSYPFDWCFIGAPEDEVHTPNEKVHKSDIDNMVKLYKHLFQSL